MFVQVSQHLLTLWPKLASSLNVLAKRDGSGAIFFFGGLVLPDGLSQQSRGLLCRSR